ncbi:apoptosis-inducing factor 3 [Euwallacea fornicatus]|uniref:apoptosis-inducing factor 3 n=1 Tax=Euwallacea fornicatus TaxID=995702 RepID=UPI00339062E5
MGCNSSKSKLDITSTTDKVPTKKDLEDDFVEDVVCTVKDINENEMKTFELDEEKVLVVKQNGVIRAMGTKCTHYGAPLVNGALGEGRVRCQWHGACFNIATGDIEDFPGLDSLPCYKVTIEDNGNVKVRARKTDLRTNKRTKPMVKKLATVNERYVIIGGGPSGAVAVETLRQEGFSGEVVMVCKENYLPYDRVKVSKQMDFEISKAELRDDKFYKDNDIEVLKGVAAEAVDTTTNTISLSNGKTLKYNKLYIATGCNPRKPDVPGKELKNVCVLKDYDDSAYAYPQLNKDLEVVVIGSSFIGMEAANFCVDKVKSVTVIGRGAVPFRSIWGERIGAAILALFEKKGVKYIPNNVIKKINDNGEGFVSSVELTDGQILKCDILFCGIGSTYFTDFLKGSGLNMQPDGTVETNEYLQTNIPNVYAGGDIAYAPVWSHHNRKVAIGHYPLAHYHGRMAALNMVGKITPIKVVPYFWTMLFGKGFRYAGHGSFDDIIYAGDVENLKFMAFFLKDDEVVSTTSCGMDPYVSLFAEKLAQGKKLYRNDLKDDPMAWTKMM